MKIEDRSARINACSNAMIRLIREIARCAAPFDIDQSRKPAKPAPNERENALAHSQERNGAAEGEKERRRTMPLQFGFRFAAMYR